MLKPNYFHAAYRSRARLPMPPICTSSKDQLPEAKRKWRRSWGPRLPIGLHVHLHRQPWRQSISAFR
jgi:hypothetical protein